LDKPHQLTTQRLRKNSGEKEIPNEHGARQQGFRFGLLRDGSTGSLALRRERTTGGFLNTVPMNLIEQVRTSCKAVAQRAAHVGINHDHIGHYAVSLPVDQAFSPELDPHIHYLDHGDATVAYVLILDTINFGSGYFPHLRKAPGMSGYFNIAAALTDFFRAQGPPSAKQLTQLSPGECTRILGQDPDNKIIQELMQLFAAALSELGKSLIANFRGDYSELVKAADASAENLIRLLVKMPFFNDVARYDDLNVHFYKRAQLTAADLSIALKGQGLGFFHDLHKMTMFADNLVPHVLRMDEILLYDENLAARIDSEELIPSGSPEEVEIRACALHAVELMAEALKEAGHNAGPVGLDYVLWNRGQQPYYKKAKPRHRTRTVFY
jgi:hypothetical protein